MKAVVVHGAKDLRVETAPEIAPAADEVVVRIVYGGICGSDLHYAADGRNGPFVITEPLTLGHEVVGVVHAIGDGITAAPPVGTRVALHPATPTPKPGDAPGSGLNVAVGGSYFGSASTNPHTQGGFTDLLAVTVDQLRVLPETLPLRRAALTEPLAVALHGVAMIGDRVRGSRILVSGSGPIGALAIAALRAAGAGHVVAADLHEGPLWTARSVGADETVQIGAGETLEPDSFDIVVEASGVVASLASALETVRRRGCVLQLGVLAAGPLEVPLAGLVAKEITLQGSQRFDVEIDAAVELLAREPGLDAVISHEFDIEKAAEAFACAADSSLSAKVLLKISDDPDLDA